MLLNSFELYCKRLLAIFRKSPSEAFLGKGVLKICSKFAGEHSCQSAYFQNTFSWEHLWKDAFMYYQKQLSIGVLGKVNLKICSKFTGKHPCRSVILTKLLCNFIEIALRHGRSPVYLLIFSEHLFIRTPLQNCFCICNLVSVIPITAALEL